jgi:hypothetical protein
MIGPRSMTTSHVMASVIVFSAVNMLAGCGDGTRDNASATTSSAAAHTPPSLIAPPDKPVGGTITPPRKPVLVESGDPFAPIVVWRGDMLIVTAFGSSSCPPVATGALVVEPQVLLIHFEDPPEQACTDDYGASVSRIAAPEGDIDVERRVSAMYDLAGAERWLIRVRMQRPVEG